MNFIVDEKFKTLITELTPDEFNGLEESILKEGCRDPLAIWSQENILLDGHNRLEICKKHNIKFELKYISLEDRLAAEIWIIKNQLDRRNINKYQRGELVLVLKPMVAEKANQQQGTRTDLLPKLAESIDTREKIAKEANISHGTLDKVEKISTQGIDELKDKARSGEISIHTAAAIADVLAEEQKEIINLELSGKELIEKAKQIRTQKKREEKEKEREERREKNQELIKEQSIVDDIDSLTTKFATIVIDPPWDWGDEGDIDQLGRAKPTYITMNFDEILNLPIQNISDQDCHLYLWITNRSLPKGFSLLLKWGFRYITLLTWVKPSFGMGNYFRGQTEHILFGVKGSQMLKRKDVGTYFSAPRGKQHSSKPEKFYTLVESCSPGPYLDIFGRQLRGGWIVKGAELNGL